MSFQPIEVPIYLTATFLNPLPSGEASVSDRGFSLKYSREENPTVRELEKVVANLDGFNDCLAFNSGMAAISTLFIANRKRKILINLDSYSATLGLGVELRELGFDVEFRKTEELASYVGKGGLVFTESITNPLLRVPDLESLSDICEDSDSLLVIDNTAATPVLLKPSSFAKYSIQSVTKYLSGANDVFGGVLSGNDLSELWEWRKKLGNIMDPIRAFLVIRSIPTLELRVRKHSENALAVARWLRDHGKVEEVIYPGLETHPDHSIAKKLLGNYFGGVVSFRVRGNPRKFLLNLEKIVKATSFGAHRSLASIPYESVLSNIQRELALRCGIDEDLIRLSVGLEDEKTIIGDLERALESL